MCERQRWLVREALRGTTCQVRQSLESLGGGVLCARVDHRPPEQQHLGQDWHATWLGAIHHRSGVHFLGVVYQDLVHHHHQAVSETEEAFIVTTPVSDCVDPTRDHRCVEEEDKKELQSEQPCFEHLPKEEQEVDNHKI